MKTGAVLKRISPSAKEVAEVKTLSAQVQKSLQKQLSKRITTVLAGSVAKGTFLAGAADIDLFAIFPPSYTKEKMFEEVKKAAIAAFPQARIEEGYAEHPYLRVFMEGKRIDVVPSYKMKEGEKVKSAVDRSQLHTKYVLSRLKPAQKKEVLLLKQFLKANLLYGAEIKRKGFSGYLCELLIIQYSNFDRFIRMASGWKFSVFLDPGGHYKGEVHLTFTPKPALVVIDPVDKTRNVAAVITEENAHRLRNLALAYSQKPSEEFFFPKKMGKKEITAESKARNIFALLFPKPKNLVDDVFWGQLWRFSGQFKDFLEHAEFKVLGMHPFAEGEECVIVFEVEATELPREQVFRGPLAEQKMHLAAFRNSHRGPFFFVEGRIFSKEERSLWNIQLAAEKFMRKTDHPSHIQPELANGKMVDLKQLLADYPDALEEYFRALRFTEQVSPDSSTDLSVR